MAGRNAGARTARGFVSGCLVFALSVGAVHAADLSPAAAPAVPDFLSGWYVRLGVEGVDNEGKSNLYAQPIVGVVVPGIGFVPVSGSGPQQFLVGRDATYSSVWTASFQAGYFLNPNWSVEMAGGIPVWVQVKITGYSPTAPLSGTVLSTIMPGYVPITGVHHFTQFGPFQPYLGAGLTPAFLFTIRDGFSTKGWFAPTVGLVLQGGFEYMFSRNWGVYFDVKKFLGEATGKANGVDLGPPIGTIPAASTIKTTFEPWLFAMGVTYRF